MVDDIGSFQLVTKAILSQMGTVLRWWDRPSQMVADGQRGGRRVLMPPEVRVIYVGGKSLKGC